MAGRADSQTMPRFVVPTVVYEGDYGPALVIRSLLEAEGITTSLDDWPITSRPRATRVFVAREDVTQARRLIEARRL